MLVAAAVLLPIAVAIVWAATTTRRERQNDVRREAVSLAVAAASYLDEYLKGLDTLASVLTRHPAVTSMDRQQADRLFVAVLRQQPLLTNVLLAAPDGSIHGTALPNGDGHIAATWLDEIAKTTKPLVSAFGRGGLTGKPIVTLAYPVQDDAAPLTGILAFTLDLTQLQTVFAEIPLPAGSVVTVIDREHRILVRNRDSLKFVGTTSSEVDWSGLPRSSSRSDIDGVERLTGDATIKHASWLVSVGIPASVVAERQRGSIQRNVALALTIVVGSLLLSLWLGQVMTRHLRTLQAAVQRIAEGDLSPPAVSPAANRELGTLQDAFVTMAAKLREARVNHAQQVEQERKLNETLKALQQQIVRQERLAAVGNLASGVAHEVNNPLQAIVGGVELIERRQDLAPETREELAFVKAQGLRAREIIRSLSRFSSQQIGPPSLVDLRDVIAEVTQLRSRELEASSLIVRIETTPTRKVHANFAELEQVTLSFVRNAQQAIEAEHFGEGRGLIAIRLFEVGQKIRLEVHDNGPGVSPDNEPKLFQPFFTTRPVGQGTGLGLSVGYGIIHSYHGEIGYFRNEWGGATFFFELPAWESDSNLSSDSMTHDRAAVLRHIV